jgi:hypothetical protein
LIIPIDLKPLKGTMPTTTPTILDQISAEKTKISERLARLDTDRAAVATRLTDLETTERVLTRVGQTPAARRTTAAAAAAAKATAASRGRGRPTRAAAEQVSGRQAQRTEASASAFWLWLPAGPDRNFTKARRRSGTKSSQTLS